VNAARLSNWSNTRALAVCMTILSFTGLVVPAYSANSYADGCKSYSAGDYKAAENSFREAVAAYPGNPVVHYLLANTEIGLHKRVEAKAEYSRCLQLHPDPSTASHCQKMLAFLNNTGTSRSVTAVASAPSPSAAETEKETKKQEIIRKANAEAAAIREEVEKQIAEGGAPGNQQLVRNRETGEIKVGVSSTQAEIMREEANARAEKIQLAGKDRALHM
jgi:predicted Zn-dependent protease